MVNSNIDDLASWQVERRNAQADLGTAEKKSLVFFLIYLIIITFTAIYLRENASETYTFAFVLTLMTSLTMFLIKAYMDKALGRIAYADSKITEALEAKFAELNR
jgi:uncharacterized membrane protein